LEFPPVGVTAEHADGPPLVVELGKQPVPVIALRLWGKGDTEAFE
jgi:hypothetical protein